MHRIVPLVLFAVASIAYASPAAAADRPTGADRVRVQFKSPADRGKSADAPKKKGLDKEDRRGATPATPAVPGTSPATRATPATPATPPSK